MKKFMYTGTNIARIFILRETGTIAAAGRKQSFTMLQRI